MPPAVPQENVLKESEMMIPETRQRLEAALADLQTYLVRRRGRRPAAPGGGCAPPRAAAARAAARAAMRRLLPCAGCCHAPCAHRDPCRRPQSENEADLAAGEEVEAAKQAVGEVEPLFQS
jgi:hypothetical protein